MVNPNMAIAPARIAAWQREAEYRAKAKVEVKPAGEAVEAHLGYVFDRRFDTHRRVADHKHPLRFAGCDNDLQIQRKLELIREEE